MPTTATSTFGNTVKRFGRTNVLQNIPVTNRMFFTDHTSVKTYKRLTILNNIAFRLFGKQTGTIDLNVSVNCSIGSNFHIWFKYLKVANVCYIKWSCQAASYIYLTWKVIFQGPGEMSISVDLGRNLLLIGWSEIHFYFHKI